MGKALPLLSYDCHLKPAPTGPLRFERCRLAGSGGSRRYAPTTLQLLVSSLLIIYQWASQVCTASSKNGGDLGAEGNSQGRRDQGMYQSLSETRAWQEENPTESPDVSDVSFPFHSNVPETFRIAEREDESLESSREPFSSQRMELVFGEQMAGATPRQQVPVPDMETNMGFSEGWETGVESVSDTSESLSARSFTASEETFAAVPLGFANEAVRSAQSLLPPKYEDVLLDLHSEGAVPPRLQYWELFDPYLEEPAEEPEQHQRQRLSESLKALLQWRQNLLAVALIVIVFVALLLIFST